MNTSCTVRNPARLEMPGRKSNPQHGVPRGFGSTSPASLVHSADHGLESRGSYVLLHCLGAFGLSFFSVRKRVLATQFCER